MGLFFVMNNLNLLFLITLFLGTIISISANSIFMSWMGLEINLLSFIPMMANTKNILSNESMLKYFLIQAMGSSLFLFSSILNVKFQPSFFYMNFNEMINILIMLTLMLKLGSSPFHNWFINIIEGMSWMTCFLILTWQKIAPLCLLFYININFNILMMFIILSSLIGAIGGLNQTSLRKILAFSSINHLGWMISSMILSKYILILYFLIYSFINFTLIMIFNNFFLFYINQSYFILYKKMNIFLFLSLLSLGGLPPLLGFFPKWLIIEKMMYSNLYMLNFILILTSLITIFYYLQISFSSILLLKLENKIIMNNMKNIINSMFLNICTFISILGLVLFLIIKSC
uniref:NADH-ubiquinone oxidoreductase chain 2 n=1 Tax=Lepidopsocidae sp. RS-2001 TaxID=159971 RepID=Q7YHM3_9NEOP|nr:NADH dehydrogenase subunit 2 [Lepidopsocidae sp. RS-2001]AAP44715.1 NADH dehydrogenase subunit 2 [Lepidopsocidae sp. RS-2001]